MGFFQGFWDRLNGVLDSYIHDTTMNVAFAFAPATVAFGTLYIIVWGYLHLMGKIDEPFTTGLKRISMLALVFLVSLQLALYNDIIVDTFYRAPMEFAKWIVFFNDPTSDPGNLSIFAPVTIVDEIWSNGGQVAEGLLLKASVNASNPFGGSFLPLLVTAFIIFLIVAALCLYTMFLLAMSKVALAVLLALGPIFFVMLLFESTSRFFMSWIAQLANYALVVILTTMGCLLILQMVKTGTEDTLRRGPGIAVVDTFDMLLLCGLGMLFMMQVPQIAASLATGGPPLGTHGVGARAASMAGGFSRGLFSSEKNSNPAVRDGWTASRRAGFAVRKLAGALIKRENTIERDK